MTSSKAAASFSSFRVKVFWGDVLYDTVLCRPGETVTVGSDKKSTFILPKHRSLELARVQNDGTATIKFSKEIDGHLKTRKEVISLSTARDAKKVMADADGLFSAQLMPGENADMVIDHLSFYFDWENEIQILPKSNASDKRRFLGLLFPLIFFLLVSITTLVIPRPEPEIPPERLVEIIQSKPKPPPPPPPKQATAAMGEKKSLDGGAQKGDSGKAAVQPKAEKPSAAQVLKNANIGSLLGNLTNIGATAPTVSNTGIKGAKTQEGTGGFSTQGVGTGGGGQSVGIGRAVGKGLGGFEGTGRLGLSGNSALDNSTGHGDTDTYTTRGGLDRDVIESIIRRRQDRIRLCYERQLNFNPKLAGKVTIHFVIGKTGTVISSSILEDTMKSEPVRKCILMEVKEWTFPTPEGGTTVNVDYPFVFESSNKL